MWYACRKRMQQYLSFVILVPTVSFFHHAAFFLSLLFSLSFVFPFLSSFFSFISVSSFLHFLFPFLSFGKQGQVSSFSPQSWFPSTRYDPEQPRIQMYLLGHSLIHLLVACTTHLFACSALLASFACFAAPIHLPVCSLTPELVGK